MAAANGQGLAGLVDLVSVEALRRSTGEVDVGGRGAIYMVFGHPLHAVLGELTGMAAVDGIADLLRASPDLGVAWTPGRTAGRAQTLSPSAGVADRLRAAMPPGLAAAPATPARNPWDGVAAQACALIEAGLHRHARALTEVIRAAAPEQAAILAAIERARAMPVRAVSPVQVTALLNEAETLVRRHHGGQ